MAFAPKPLREQVIVITGASSGIGLTTARMAAHAGASVLLVARNEGALRHIVEDLRASGANADYVVADVSRPEDHTRIAQVAVQRFGGFDTWVNGAAVGTAGELMDVPIEDQRQVLDVNYWGVVYGSLEAARHLRHRGGVLINIGSVLGERAVVLQVPYCAAKHAVRAFTDGLRMELEREGAPIAVTHIKPSSIDTPFPEHARNFLDTGVTVPPPIYSPDLVAKAILFACENPRRDIVVGFGGWVVPLMGTLAPRLTDRLMEAIGYWAQKTTRRSIPARRDNLYHPRQDGAERSSFNYPMVRRSSLLLQAQMHPVATATILGGMVAGLAAVGITRRTRRRERLGGRQA
jgi:NAD(P)-dependent dehydrogenase (short-subunit alcohol dehydrogenase family)